MALRVPSAVALKNDFAAKQSYPFAQHRYGAGSNFYARQAAAQLDPPSKTGSGTPFYAKQAAASFAPPTSGSGAPTADIALEKHMPGHTLEATGYGAHGTGYMGPTGWVNTQPYSGRPEQRNLKSSGPPVVGDPEKEFWTGLPSDKTNRRAHHSLRMSDSRKGRVRVSGRRHVRRGRRVTHSIGSLSGRGESDDLLKRIKATLAK